MSQFTSGILPDAERASVQGFLEAAPRDKAALLQGLLHNPAFGGWWYGVKDKASGQLQAVAGVESGTGMLYAANPTAAQALGAGLLRDAGRHAIDTGHDHTLLGEASTMEPFWSQFQNTPRKLLKDRALHLYQATAPIATASLTITAARAVAAQQPLLEEWLALHALETWGMDPRRSAKAAHQKRVAAVIASGHQWVAQQRGAPVLCAESIPLLPGVAMIERAFAMKPSRRPRVLKGALSHIAHHLNQEGHGELLAFDDAQQGYLGEALQEIGFTQAATWRMLSLR